MRGKMLNTDGFELPKVPEIRAAPRKRKLEEASMSLAKTANTSFSYWEIQEPPPIPVMHSKSVP